MEIGSLGNVVFSVSADKIQTIRDMTRQGSAGIQVHKRHLDVDLPEFVGTDLEGSTFSIRLSKYLGVSNPKDELDKLISYMQKGTPVYFVMGTERIGQYKWLIANYKVVYEHYDKKGTPVTMDVSITLKEYPKR